MFFIKHLIGIHQSDEIFRIGEIDDVVGIPRQHIHGFRLISPYLKLNHFLTADLSLLDETMPAYDNEDLPFAVVPVLPFDLAGLGNIDGELTAV